MDMWDYMAHAIMKAAENEAHSNEEPKYAIQLFDSWIDCRALARAAAKGYMEYCEKQKQSVGAQF